jgi:FMN-dependent dehydrogenase
MQPVADHGARGSNVVACNQGASPRFLWRRGEQRHRCLVAPVEIVSDPHQGAAHRRSCLRCFGVTIEIGWIQALAKKHAYLPFQQGQGIANYLSDPAFRAGLGQPPEADPRAAIMRFLELFGNPAFSWDGVDFLRSLTKLPILLKGITHPDDAALALEHNVDGIVVSNHGGRQVDGPIAL